MLEQLKSLEGKGIAVSSAPDGELIVAAVTPLMGRAHSLASAGEVVFLDSSGNMDRDGLRVFLMMTWSAAGGVPLGVVIASSETTAMVTEGMKMLAGLAPDGKITW